jgi:hypothetical protein
MAAVGKPEENGFAERLMRTIKEEELDLSEYQDFNDAYRQLGGFLDDVHNRNPLVLWLSDPKRVRAAMAEGAAINRGRVMAHGPNPTAFGAIRPDARLLGGKANPPSDIHIIYLGRRPPWTIVGRPC